MAHLPGRPEDSPPILRDVQDASLGTQWAGLGPPPPSCTFLFIVKKNTGRESCVKRPRLESRITRREPPRRLILRNPFPLAPSTWRRVWGTQESVFAYDLSCDSE
ncbi:uncharacterized protein LOC122678167 isoform X3 [Cervus elaphus]|uniref:uncharacterized protein LOC122678167 isoform X3 n=1 Tax=Cervus elaphus TaxID=9860 RepID=UPI001CC27955|nr:uncharacterized protein LOC122678167 isoform X3 [Cervus elaphus]